MTVSYLDFHSRTQSSFFEFTILSFHGPFSHGEFITKRVESVAILNGIRHPLTLKYHYMKRGCKDAQERDDSDNRIFCSHFCYYRSLFENLSCSRRSILNDFLFEFFLNRINTVSNFFYRCSHDIQSSLNI